MTTVSLTGYETPPIDLEFDALLFAAQRVSETQQYAAKFGPADGFDFPTFNEFEYYVDAFKYMASGGCIVNYWVNV